jgi:hypothetical protein
LVLQIDHRSRSRRDNLLNEIDPVTLLRQPLAATSLADLDSAALDLLADAALLARTVTTVCPADLQARLAEARSERDPWLATGMAAILITLQAEDRPRVAIDAAEAVLTRLSQGQSATLPRGHAAMASQLLAAIGVVDAGLLLDENHQALNRLLSAWTANRQCVLPRSTVAQIAVGLDPAPAQVRSAIAAAGVQGLRRLAAVLSAYA